MNVETPGHSVTSLLIGELLIDYHHQANVGRHVHQIRYETFVKTGHSFVPPCFLYAIPAARVVGVLVLQPGADHLVRVGGRGGDQLGDGGEQQILAGGLGETRWQKWNRMYKLEPLFFVL